MQADLHTAGRLCARHLPYLILALAFVAGLYGCASPAQSQPAPPPMAAIPAPPTAVPATAPSPAETLLAYAERVRSLQPAELAQEINGLGDPQDSTRQMQLAIALGTARTPGNAARAQALLQRVLAQNQPQAQVLHPLARMLLAQQADARRLEEQLERQSQQTKDAHRRIELLNDRLEALRAVERSLLLRPAAAMSAPANGQRLTP
ncbi:hypothetical protein [Caenimonas soli]|uniref:hypothetical protein n=1 Tax=Caenimonas soli TaxID=2735555 RepID=UPI0015551120|nr:hypothetical protein [Caenimonas soli]NPC58886.1 hypothetical protein [Caenimonas soli]